MYVFIYAYIYIYIKNITKHQRNYLISGLERRSLQRGLFYNFRRDATSIAGYRKNPSPGRVWVKAVMYSQESSCHLTSFEVCTINLGGECMSVLKHEVSNSCWSSSGVPWACSGQKSVVIFQYTDWLLIPYVQGFILHFSKKPGWTRPLNGNHGNRATHPPQEGISWATIRAVFLVPYFLWDQNKSWKQNCLATMPWKDLNKPCTSCTWICAFFGGNCLRQPPDDIPLSLRSFHILEK